MGYFRELYEGTRSLLVGMWITLRQCFKPVVTIQYPRQQMAIPPRFRGHIDLTKDEQSGESKCVVCMACQKACPSACIAIDGEKVEGRKTKMLTRYTLDFTKCSLCGLCVESCRFDAIHFSRTYNAVSARKEDFIYDLLLRLKEGRR